jgi:hypothetical protein
MLQAGVYGQCLAGKLTELEKGVCQKEFVQFNTCMQQAMVPPPQCALQLTSHSSHAMMNPLHQKKGKGRR